LVAKGGENIGIEAGLAVIGTNGLIGRVISSGQQSSRILLLTDFNSNIPVVALASDVHAILAGRNNASPELQFIPRKAELKDGDLLVTSGRGGRIPIGLPVGLLRLDADGGVPKVELLDDVKGLIHVRVVKSAQIEAPPDIDPSARKGR
jgi:rod shape-determining protein MreC